MTTICIKDGIMAADSQETGGDLAYRCIKLYRVEGHVIGLAGDSAAGFKFLAWLEKGGGRDVPEFSDEEDFEALIANRGGDVFTVDKNLIWYPAKLFKGGYYAIGSGSAQALTAMSLGASAVKAVHAAAETDIYTSPPVDRMYIK